MPHYSGKVHAIMILCVVVYSLSLLGSLITLIIEAKTGNAIVIGVSLGGIAVSIFSLILYLILFHALEYACIQGEKFEELLPSIAMKAPSLAPAPAYRQSVEPRPTAPAPRTVTAPEKITPAPAITNPAPAPSAAPVPSTIRTSSDLDRAFTAALVSKNKEKAFELMNAALANGVITDEEYNHYLERLTQ
jgi:hypothetical protein